ncbi:Zinc-regulated transporter 2 [Pleurostoma richardsiae]|uniref:Zinc-regulated transporter 2 n=1 Tax=Pleurostoma richardsiae TaxID=41990 RepID=A0AA38R596_9PEZI|nr:Zinc-regulated transporter 2 [Pleurostoma richardsiae]
MAATLTAGAPLATDDSLDSGTFTVTVECDSGNDYDGRLGLRISSIFVILIGALLGAVLPVFLARTKRFQVPKLAFFVAKYFGSGVIVATAFIHLLAPAQDALTSPCYGDDATILGYSWVEGIVLMTIFVMFLIELLASRYEIKIQGATARDPSLDLLAGSAKEQDVESGKDTSAQSVSPEKNLANPEPGMTSSVSYPPGGEDHLGHAREHTDTDFAAQMTALFILEFGVIFHSIFIGLTLAVSGDEFNILYVVLVFHQTFEGLGLGSRLAVAVWPRGKGWLPYVLGAAYAISTPLAIAIGLGVRTTLKPGSLTTMMVNGVFDSISAGILIYTGLVELMAHEFMFNTEMRKSSLGMTLAAFACMCLGAGLMALLGEWA